MLQKKFLSFFLATIILFSLCENVLSAEKSTFETEVQLTEEEKKTFFIEPNNHIPEQKSTEEFELPEGYDQAIIDEINNNPIGSDSADAETTVATLSEKTDTELMPASEMSLLRVAGTSVAEEFRVEPVNAPFYAYSNNNESVSLATGALNFEKTLLSLPGRNGLNLNIAIKYNSDDAVITENEFNKDSTLRLSNSRDMAIGWSFNFTSIKKTTHKYGYLSDTCIQFSDGSSYKILNDTDNPTEDLTLTLENYPLSDISLVHQASSNQYILTYPDGITEYFDGLNGNIICRIDRFGNWMDFEYGNINFYQGSFQDYINNPSFFSTTQQVLTRIIDNSGNCVNFEYKTTTSNQGKWLYQINLKIEDTTYATLKFSSVNSYNGNVTVLNSIIDAEGLTTKFTYNEKISHIYRSNYDGTGSPSYDVNGSTFLMTRITYPTGGHTDYYYTKVRRSYSYYIPQITVVDWYETYKVSNRFDTASDDLIYLYDGDQSGYPYSYTVNGQIYDSSTQYHTIVKNNNATTIHTFDYKHNKIREQTYDDNTSTNQYVGSHGGSLGNVVVGGRIYTVDTTDNSIYIYTEIATTTSDFCFLPPCNLGEKIEIKNVKTKGSDIYVFYIKFIENSTACEYHVQIFNTQKRTWSDGGSYALSKSINGLYLDEMYYTDGIFYSYAFNNASDTIYHIVYNPSKNPNTRWSLSEATMPASPYYAFSHICAKDGMVYYKTQRVIYEYDLETNSHTSKTFSTLNRDDSVDGFVQNGRTYLYSYNYVQEFNYIGQTLGDKMFCSFNSLNSGKMRASYNGEVYYFPSEISDDGYQYVYRFTPDSDNPWTVAATRLFESEDFDVVMNYGYAYITLRLDIRTYPSTPTQHFGGYEKIYFNLSNAKRLRTDYTYNTYNQLIKSTNTTFQKQQKKILSQEEWSYVQGKNLVSSYTDVLNNKTTYDYSDSTYGIPTTIKNYAETENEIITANTLSADKTKISSSTVAYDDRALTTAYTYNSAYPGNVISEVTTENRNETETVLSQKEYEYDHEGVFITKETAKNIATNGTDFQLQSASDISHSYEYDSMGRLISETDANGKTTQYEYNKNNWLTKTTNPDGSFISADYSLENGVNRIITSYNNQYYTIDYYDGLGRIEKQTEITPDYEEVLLKNYSYNGKYLSCISDSYRNYITYWYDIYDRLIQTEYWNKNDQWLFEQTITYDDYNQKKTVKTGDSTKTTYFDVAGRVIRETPSAIGNRAEYGYDDMGNLITVVDANQGCTVNTYNDLGQLLSVTDALNQTTTYEYDAWGNVTKVTTPGGTATLHEYDALGRVLKTTDPMGGEEHFAYDNLGNLIASKDKKQQVTTYTYDVMNRLTQKKTGALCVGYTYDTLGNQLTMTDSTGTTTYGYTYNNRLERITTPDEKTISYRYDNAGNMTGMTDYVGNVFTYTYDDMNRPDTIIKDDTILANYDYNNSGSISRVTHPEGVSEYTYDNALRLTAQTNTKTNGALLNSYQYTYDVLGNRTEETDSVTGKTRTYQYDALSRLTSEREPDSTETLYTFDTNNNIMTKSVSHPVDYEYSFTQNETDYTIGNLIMHTIDYSYNDLNQLIQEREHIAGSGEDYSGFLEVVRDYTYDENGNTLQQKTSGQVDETVVQYSYNPWNQLTAYTAADGTVTQYGYDGTGMRISKTQGDTTQKFYWDRGYIVNEMIGADTVTNYVGLNGVFARESGTTPDYFFKNGHGDVVAKVNNGTTVKTYDYNAYGTEQNLDPTDTNPFRYCGEYFDQETGQIYLRNRYYNSSIGRFVTEDPIRDGLNWYVYCGNNPINYIDILGLEYDNIRDLANSLTNIFGENPAYIYNPNSVTVKMGQSGDGLYKSGKFYYDGTADIPYLNSRKYSNVKVADNRNGALYMNRENFYDAMGVRYEKHTTTLTVNKLEDGTLSVIVGLTIAKATSIMNTLPAFIISYCLEEAIDKLRLDPGTYSIDIIMAEFTNYASEMNKYEYLLTTDYYKQEIERNGIPVEVFDRSITKYMGAFEERLF